MGILFTKNTAFNLYYSQYHANIVINSHKDWFPIYSSPRLAGIIADLICDGHIQGPKLWRFDYTSKNKKELKRFEKQIFALFKIRGKIRPNHGNIFGKTFNLGINNKLLSRILNYLGAPYGPKVKTEFLIPEWVLNDKECFRTFTKRVFTCEGTVDISPKNSFVSLEMWKSIELIENGEEFLNQIKTKLKSYFGIECTNIFLGSNYNKRKDGTVTKGLRLRIKRLDSLIKFSKEIGFDNSLKQKKLDKIIKIRLGQSGMGQ